MQTLGAILRNQASLGAIFSRLKGFYPCFQQIKTVECALATPAPHLQHCFF